jgi:hypothetical protein
MENLVPMGKFAPASLLSQKALRLYGENGLLPPGWVDPDSGYRYYDLGQLETASLAAGEVAFTEVEGEQCDYPFVLGAYKALYHWGKERGRKLNGSPREIYFFKPGRTPRMEIAFPLQ